MVFVLEAEEVLLQKGVNDVERGNVVSEPLVDSVVLSEHFGEGEPARWPEGKPSKHPAKPAFVKPFVLKVFVVGGQAFLLKRAQAMFHQNRQMAGAD